MDTVCANHDELDNPSQMEGQTRASQRDVARDDGLFAGTLGEDALMLGVNAQTWMQGIAGWFLHSNSEGYVPKYAETAA